MEPCAKRENSFVSGVRKWRFRLQSVSGNSAFEVGTDRRAVRYAAARPAVAPYHEQATYFPDTL